METLKKFLLVIVFVSAMQFTYSQQITAKQKVYYKNYDLEKSGNYTTAIKELNTIYKSDDYFANIRLGWLYYLSKQYANSISFYEKAISLKPYAIEAKFGLIKPLSAIENWEKVKSTYHQILKIDPQNTVAGYWLGLIYYNRRDYINANKLFEKVVNLYPLDYDSGIMLAWTKLKLGKTAEAKVLFQHTLTLRPNDSSSLEGLKLIK